MDRKAVFLVALMVLGCAADSRSADPPDAQRYDTSETVHEPDRRHLLVVAELRDDNVLASWWLKPVSRRETEPQSHSPRDRLNDRLELVKKHVAAGDIKQGLAELRRTILLGQLMPWPPGSPQLQQGLHQLLDQLERQTAPETRSDPEEHHD